MLISTHFTLQINKNGEWQKEKEEREKEKERRICRKWYSIAAGKDTESGPQLHTVEILCSSLFTYVRSGTLAPWLHIYSHFRNNNYLISEATVKCGPTGQQREKERKREEERQKETGFLLVHLMTASEESASNDSPQQINTSSICNFKTEAKNESATNRNISCFRHICFICSSA